MKMHLNSINVLDIVLDNKIQLEKNDTECENWKQGKTKPRQQLMVPVPWLYFRLLDCTENVAAT
jgi:hypothetical protein